MMNGISVGRGMGAGGAWVTGVNCDWDEGWVTGVNGDEIVVCDKGGGGGWVTRVNGDGIVTGVNGDWVWGWVTGVNGDEEVISSGGGGGGSVTGVNGNGVVCTGAGGGGGWVTGVNGDRIVVCVTGVNGDSVGGLVTGGSWVVVPGTGGGGGWVTGVNGDWVNGTRGDNVGWTKVVVGGGDGEGRRVDVKGSCVCWDGLVCGCGSVEVKEKVVAGVVVKVDEDVFENSSSLASEVVFCPLVVWSMLTVVIKRTFSGNSALKVEDDCFVMGLAVVTALVDCL
jgi:hypothetical protein